jgi:hypothetical protein
MTREEATPAALDSNEGLRQSWPDTHKTFGIGDKVRKVRGSQWRGRVVGWYSTDLTLSRVSEFSPPVVVQISPPG